MTASTTISYDIVPGRQFGEIPLGLPLIDVVRRLNRPSEYGVVYVSCEGRPSHSPVRLFSAKRKLSFHFDPVSQLLNTVVLEDVACGEVIYRGNTLASALRLPTLAQVYDVLGPTFQGSLNVTTGKYTLQYPGIDVEFSIPAVYYEEFGARGSHPTRLPNGSTPVANKISVHWTTTTPHKAAASSAASHHPLQQEKHFIHGRIVAGDSVTFSWRTEEVIFQQSSVCIPLGICPQELMQRLGAAPHKIFNIMDHRMDIHNHRPKSLRTAAGVAPSQSGENLVESRLPSYSLNYPSLGIDFVFSGTHALKKVLVRNPLPSHETYLRYQRCNFACKVPLSVQHSAETTSSLWTVVMDNNFIWTPDCEAKAAALGVRPLMSSNGCSNGLVMKIYAFFGVVIYVMPPEGLIVSVMFVAKPPASTVKPLIQGTLPQSTSSTEEAKTEENLPSPSLPSVVEMPSVVTITRQRTEPLPPGQESENPSDDWFHEGVSPMKRSETMEASAPSASMAADAEELHETDMCESETRQPPTHSSRRFLEADEGNAAVAQDDSPLANSRNSNQAAAAEEGSNAAAQFESWVASSQPPPYSVPPPYEAHHSRHNDHNPNAGWFNDSTTDRSEGEHYEDDFVDDGTSVSDRLSSLAPSAERSPFLWHSSHATAPTELEQHVDPSSWNLPPASQTVTRRDRDAPSMNLHDTPQHDDTEELGGASAGEYNSPYNDDDAEATPTEATSSNHVRSNVAARSLTSSVSTSKSQPQSNNNNNNNSKKNKKKKR